MTPMRPMNLTRCIYAADWTAIEATPEQGQAIRSNGWMVVNTPRPLPCYGEVVQNDGRAVHQSGVKCTDDPLYSVFFAAGDPAWLSRIYDTIRDDWRSQDANPLELVSDTGRLEELAKEVAGGYFEEYCQWFTDLHGDNWLVELAKDRPAAIVRLKHRCHTPLEAAPRRVTA